ncbi:dihydroorotase [candidate division CSSED10-310 bacterium]|uniref:Dihydroorotase n=1 Tax=candidate division CSSED10-310 bacterium TaxID=2855610 RepID=A0ABV6Z4K7_UNCC1
MKKLLKGGTLIDPGKIKREQLDVLIEEDKIAFIAPQIAVDDAEIIDVSGAIVTPGLIDIHVHLREPGREDKETIESGTKAALAGGFTAVACMPNTNPVNDNQSVIQFILTKAAAADQARVYPIGNISQGSKGEELCEIGELVSYGAVAISDDGRPVMNAELMRRALEYSKMFDIPVIEHAEDLNLAGKGVINEGYMSTILGLPSQPGIAEDIIVDRDIRLAHYTSSHIHIAHISRRESLDIVRQAKARGIRVTCEVTPHHLTLTEDCLKTFDTNYKMNPPLRTGEDVEALIEGLVDGTIDAIASDHAPHTVQEKDVEFTLAPFGIIGLETSLPVLLTDLVESGKVTFETLIERFTTGAARVLHLSRPALEKGKIADITVIAPDFEYVINPAEFYSKSRNTPYGEKKVKGCAVMTLVNGKVLYQHPTWQPG